MYPSRPIQTDLSREANLSQKIEWLGARRNRAALAPVNLRVCQGPAVSIGHRCCPLKPDMLRTTLETPIADWPVRQDNPTTGVDGCCARGASVDFDAVADPSGRQLSTLQLDDLLKPLPAEWAQQYFTVFNPH